MVRNSNEDVKQLIRVNAVQVLAMACHQPDRELAESYAKRWQQGTEWPPIQAHESGYVVDGQRRLLAAFLLNHQRIAVEIV